MIGINKEPSYKAFSVDHIHNNSISQDIDEARNHPLKTEGKLEGSICEAANCFLPAAIQIEVQVGQLGNISLSLCNECVSKFRDEK